MAGRADEMMGSVFGEPENQNMLKEKLESFARRAAQERTRLVLVTAGGTSVPLERNAVRSLENFSTGRRGAISAEHFARMHYFVIYFHRDGCTMPFLRTLWDHVESGQAVLSIFKTSNDTVVLRDEIPKKFQNAFVDYEKFKDNILTIPFSTLSQYMHSLYTICSSIKCLEEAAMIYLAAAVSDYFIPENELPTHKIQSSSGNLVLNLQPVPKLVTNLVESWVPNAFVVTFKLETDPEILDKKSKDALKKYKHHAVVANVLQTRYTNVKIFTKSKKYCIDLSDEEIQNSTEIEEKIVESLVSFHKNFIGK